MAIRLEILDIHGRTTSIQVDKVISIDGKPFGSQVDPGVESRLVIIESQVADLVQFRDALLNQKPAPEGTTPP